MNSNLWKNAEEELYNKLKWLTFCRVIFTTLLLGSTILIQLGRTSSPKDESLLILYALISGIFILSFFYSLMLYYVKKRIFFAYIQIIADTFLVTLIIFITGSFSSLFSFLYLVVIIYASMLLFRKGSMIMASLCSIQYGIMIDLEFYSIIKPLGERNLIIVDYTITNVLYKIIIMMVACFAVAFLSSLLSEQERKTKKELRIMEDHVKRVEKMAAVGEMAAGLAHEIKNPLASLRGSVQILKEEIEYNPDHDKLMHIILRGTDRLNSLVNDFLLFAKPPAGKTETVDLGKILTETLNLFEKNNTYCNRITVTKKITESELRIKIDPAHLRQILWNLLLNAAEAIKNTGHIDIQMYLFKNRYAILKISDSGCGMSAKTMDMIFDPFYTTKPDGTGLGLSIVHRIVESYNIWLNVESELDKGTTFTLQFKLVSAIS